jgi:serralysin
VRYNANGRLDQTFSGDGKAYVNFTSAMDYVDEIALNDDGTILAAGIAITNDGGRFALARFEADGDLDSTFSGNGKLTTDFTPRFDGAFGVAIQTDERIVAVGAAGRNIGLARYEPNGDLDATFGGGDGTKVTSFTPAVDSADDVVLSAGGGIFVGGVGGLDRVDSKFAIAAYTPTGRLDDSFSEDGKVMTNMSPRFDWALDIAIDPSDKLVTAGIAANTQKSAVARYETN